MKTLYYTVEKELQSVDGFEETTGHKTIRVYDFVENKPILIFEIEADNENSSQSELDFFVEETLQEEDFETHLDKEETFTFELL